MGTDEEALMRIIIARSEIDMVEIKQAFFDKFQKSLAKMIKVSLVLSILPPTRKRRIHLSFCTGRCRRRLQAHSCCACGRALSVHPPFLASLPLPDSVRL
jgi:hypothetical protein